MNRSLARIWEAGSVWVAVLLLGLAAAAQPETNSPARAGSVEDTPGRLSLADAQRIAMERNWDLLATATGVDAATAQKIVAREFPNPTLAASSSKIKVDNQPSSAAAGNGIWDRSYDTIFAINQLLEIGGKRGSRKASAQAGFEGAKAQFFDAKRTLDLAITKAYVGAVQAEENVRVLKQSAATLRKEAQLAEVRRKAGEISDSDESQIQITAEKFELDAGTAESAAAQARITLEVLLAVRRPRGEVVLSDGLEKLGTEVPATETSPSGFGRPDVMAAEAALRRAEAELRLQKANRIPDPTLLAHYEHEPPDAFNTVGIGVSFPLPLWNRNRGNILAAEAAREQARLVFEKIQTQAAADIAAARFAYEDAARRWQSYRESIRPRSEQIRKTMAYAYQKGGASLLDLLVAERNDNDVRLAAAQAAGDTAVAVAALKAATLVIQPSQIKK
ncbi:MAG: outer membrane protein heavy metal efflux system [Verrucomicrobiota bacterium]